MRRALPGAMALGLLLTAPLVGQRATNALDLSAGVRDGQQRGSVMLSRRWPLVGGALSVGLGVRVTAYRGDSLRLEQVGDAAPFAPEAISLRPKVVGANLAAMIGLQLYGPLSVGANLDLIGYAIATQVATPAGETNRSGASYFQNGTGDRGSLTSEFYGALRMSRRLSLRAGLSHYVIGYETASIEGDSRYQRFVDVSFVGLRLDF